MKKEKKREVKIHIVHTIDFVKDTKKEYNFYIYFRKRDIPEIDSNFAMYLSSNHADLIELFHLIKNMTSHDKIELKFTKTSI